MTNLRLVLLGGSDSLVTDPPDCGGEGSPEPSDRVEVSVHEAVGQPGDYIVRLLQVEGDSEIRRSRWLVTEADGGVEEAQALCESLCRFVEAGLPVEALFGEEE